MPRIDQLPAGSALDYTELVPVRQGDVTVRVPLSDILNPTIVTTAAEAQAAYEAGKHCIYRGSRRISVIIPLDEANEPETNWTVLSEAKEWLANSRGKIDLEAPDGYFESTGASIECKAGENEFSLKGSATPTYVTITSIDYGTTVDGRVPVTVGVGSALPDRVVPGYALGMQAVYGDNDAAAATGALVVETVAVDRLTFTATFWLRRYASTGDDPDAGTTYYQPVDPTTISTQVLVNDILTSSVNGVTISKLMIPQFCINFLGDWNGATTEGAICAVEGGRVRTVNCGFSYNSNHDDAGTIAFVKHPGSTWYSERDVFAGGPEKVIRVPTEGVFRGQLSCYGGGGIGTHPDAGSNAEVINVQEGGKCYLVRCSVGGGKTHTVVGSNKSYLDVNQSFLSGGTSGVRVSALAWADVLATRITHSQRGVYAVNGTITMGGSSAILNCYVDVGWGFGGFVANTPNTLSNNYISATGNVLTNGGGWYLTGSKGLYDPGPRLSPAAGAGVEATLSGTGVLELIGSNLNLIGTIRFVASTSGCSASWTGDMGSTFDATILTTEPTIASGTSGKVVIGIFVRSSATYIKIYNRTASSAVLRAYARGDVTLGSFTAVT
jgi:hypothetical protein